MFARLLHDRLSPILEKEQSHDQFGFRSNRRIEDVFAILESIITKTTELNVPLWMVSIDLRKAFDRLDQPALFRALRPGSRICMRAETTLPRPAGRTGRRKALPNHKGSATGRCFGPNAALEALVAEWKRRLNTQGVALTGEAAEERQTNIRYADDLLVVAKSMPPRCLTF